MKKSTMKKEPVLGRIVQSLAPYRLTLLLALISGIMYVVLTLWAPVVIGWAVDLLLGAGLVQFGGVVRYLLLLGAMIGLEFVKDPVTKAPNGDLVSALVQECARHGLLIENAGRWGQVVRFLAPLTITDRQLHCGLDILENALKTCTQ